MTAGSISRSLTGKFLKIYIESGIFGERSQISTNQKLESSAFMRLPPDWLKLVSLPQNTVLYNCFFFLEPDSGLEFGFHRIFT